MSTGNQYGQLFERLPLVAYVTDLDHRARLRYVSHYVEELLGYPPADWLGDSPLFAERLHPDDRERVLTTLRRATLADAGSLGEFRMIARDGRTVWLADRRIATEHDDGDLIVGVLEDVTARKQAERELARSRHVSASVLESLGEGLLVLDRSGQVISANRKAARLLGVGVADLTSTGIGRPVVQSYLEDGTPLEEQNSIALRVLREEADQRDVHIRLVRPDGSEIWVSANYLLLRGDDDEAPRGVIWSLVDITESRRVAHALAESERRFRDVAENVQAVFWIRDAHTNEIVYVGPAYEELWGRPVDVVYSDSGAWLDAIHPDDRAAVKRSAFEGAPGDYDVEYRIIRPDGTIRWIHDRAFALRGSAGRDELVTGMAEDVTERHETEAALAEARERARAAFLHAPIGSAMISLEGGRPGKVIEANPALCAMLGFPEADLLGSDPNSFLVAGNSPEGLALWRSLVAGETESYDVERRLTRADGRQICARLRMSLVRNGAGEAVYGVVQAEDISAAVRAQAQATAVAELGQHALTSPDLDELTHEAVETVRTTLDALVAGVHEHDEAGNRFVLRLTVGTPDGATPAPSIHLADGAQLREAWEERRAAVVTDWHDESRYEPTPFLVAAGVRSTAAAPIQSPQGVWGVLSVHAAEPGAFGGDEVAFVQAVANVLGAAIHRRATEDETRYRALHDPLTELPNRTLFLDRLGHALDRAQRAGTGVAVLFMDLDHFKVINDSLGHEVGDRLLCAFAPRLTEVLRPSDTVARFGGDEFVVLCEDLHGEADVVHLADRILDCLREPFEIGSHELFTSATIGLALARPGDEPEGLIRDADAAMYRAKASGRARYELFDEAMRERVSERLSIETALRRTVADRALSVHFQPVVALADRSIVGAEALLRWKHPERGWIGPEQFIPIAEESGLIVEIGEWVLEQAMQAAMRWPEVRPGGGKPQLAVNLSARQVAQRGFSEKLAAALLRTGLPPERLSLEITESVLMEEAEAPVETVRELKRLGIALVLDDFGTGYSSLSYLNRLPIDVLKLDRSFIARLRDQRESSAAIVSGVVTMAEALGMTVVAEGVEEASQVEQLRALGCSFAQGFFFARPMPAGELECLLQSRPQMPAPARP